MGGRGASSGISSKGKKYGTEYTTGETRLLKKIKEQVNGMFIKDIFTRRILKEITNL